MIADQEPKVKTMGDTLVDRREWKRFDKGVLYSIYTVELWHNTSRKGDVWQWGHFTDHVSGGGFGANWNCRTEQEAREGYGRAVAEEEARLAGEGRLAAHEETQPPTQDKSG